MQTRTRLPLSLSCRGDRADRGSRNLRFGLLGSGLLFTGLMALTFSACDGNDDASPTLPSFEAGPSANPASVCNTCVAQECLGPWALCLTDPECAALRACSSPLAPNGADTKACFCAGAGDAGSSSDGGVNALAAYRMFASCNDARACTTCSSSCSGTCASGGRSTVPPSCNGDAGADLDGSADADAATPDAGDAGEADDAGDAGDAPTDAGEVDAAADASAAAPTGVDQCNRCVIDKCNDPRKSCGPGTECLRYLDCAASCADSACTNQCGSTHATGRVVALELSDCMLSSCILACGL